MLINRIRRLSYKVCLFLRCCLSLGVSGERIVNESSGSVVKNLVVLLDMCSFVWIELMIGLIEVIVGCKLNVIKIMLVIS